MTQEKPHKRKIIGVVISDKMSKTRVVRVDRDKKHKKYLKQYRVSTHFKAHDENNEYKVGDTVVIEESRPLSRDKRWKIKGLASEREQKAKRE